MSGGAGHDLDVVAVRVADVAGVVAGFVLREEGRFTEYGDAHLDRGPVHLVHMLAAVGAEGDMEFPVGTALGGDDPDVRLVAAPSPTVSPSSATTWVPHGASRRS